MASASRTALVPIQRITQSIVVVRGRRVLMDSELAELYGVSTARLNQQVRRNRERFPADFLFELTAEEVGNLMLQSATSSWGGRRKLPFAFTEHGAIMVATILNSSRAVEMSVYVVRAFVKLRAAATENRDLRRKLDELERSVGRLDRKTRKRFNAVYLAIRALTQQPTTKRRPIGFTADIQGDS